MRNITEQATQAFFEGRNFKLSNTEVHADCTGIYLKLWGNLIAKRVGEHVSISLAGYNTSTTKERLRGVLSKFNKTLVTKKGSVIIKNLETLEEINYTELTNKSNNKFVIVSR
jgi:hypothetical protein